mmetsp:Transcript_106286/g.266230  ORF Transcript_106286/g.266230 Transcript_106286/m.266230 type:complete len:94 (+) Transcript_106286:1386-1667(+)
MGSVVPTRLVRFHVLAQSLNLSLPLGGVRSHCVNPLAVQEGLSCRDESPNGERSTPRHRDADAERHVEQHRAQASVSAAAATAAATVAAAVAA